MKNEQEMEFIWRPSWQEMGKDAEIFCHLTFDHYSPPFGFDIEDEKNRENKQNKFETNKNSGNFNAP